VSPASRARSHEARPSARAAAGVRAEPMGGLRTGGRQPP